MAVVVPGGLCTALFDVDGVLTDGSLFYGAADQCNGLLGQGHGAGLRARA
jgi:3-deoxy-D-manno-octulosonate 8-phosphate phosphatase KdsC-like HAD superfamily phosphatase